MKSALYVFVESSGSRLKKSYVDGMSRSDEYDLGGLQVDWESVILILGITWCLSFFIRIR